MKNKVTQFIKRNNFLQLYFIFLSLFYFISRSINLTLIPIFTDEAIYLRWSQIMSLDWARRFLPVEIDGKPPLFMWITSVAMKFFPNVDPLILGRGVAVISGYLGLLGIIFLAYQLFKKKEVSVFSGLIYLVTPFTFFYDRFGLTDGLLAALATWSLAFGIIMIRTLKLRYAIILGVIVGLDLLAKTEATFTLLFIPLSLVFYECNVFKDFRKIIKPMVLVFVSMIVSELVYGLLRLSPSFYMIGEKNKEFILTISEFLKEPFKLFLGNVSALSRWEVSYLTPSILLIVLLGLLIGFKKNIRQTIVILIYFVAYLLAMSLVNKVIYPRFLLIFTPILLIAGAYGLENIRQKTTRLLFVIIMFIVLSYPIYVNYLLIVDPVNAPITDRDSQQYINSWSSGYGFNEAVSFFQNESRTNNTITIANEGTFGLLPQGLYLYQSKFPNSEIFSFWPIPNEFPPYIKKSAKNNPTYFMVYQSKKIPSDWKVKTVLNIRQGKSEDYFRVYRVIE